MHVNELYLLNFLYQVTLESKAWAPGDWHLVVTGAWRDGGLIFCPIQGLFLPSKVQKHVGENVKKNIYDFASDQGYL